MKCWMVRRLEGSSSSKVPTLTVIYRSKQGSSGSGSGLVDSGCMQVVVVVACSQV